MNKLFITLLFALIGTTAFAQEIEIKKDIVSVDGKQCLKVDGDANNVSFLDMDGNEIIFMKYIHGSKYGEVYNKITFFNEKITFTSQSYIYTKKLLIKRLIEHKVLADCKVDKEKLERFVAKMDENIEKD